MSRKKEPENKIIKKAEESVEALKKLSTRNALAYWLAMPTKLRQPRTQKALAQLVGVSEERLCQIKREPEFKQEIMEYRKAFFRDFTSDILQAMGDAAKGGNERAAKLFLQVVEDFKETSRQERDVSERKEFVFQLTDQQMSQLKEIIEAEKERRSQKYLEACVIPDEEISVETESG